MIGRLLTLLLVLIATPAFATTRFIGPSGSGSTCSSGSPCTAATALAATVCGDTITVKDGTYQGDSQMMNTIINTPGALACTAGSPITIQGETDGGAVFDGQHARIPIRVFNAHYWTISGINGRYGGPDGAGSVLAINGCCGDSSQHITVQRVVVWDSGSGNDQVILLSEADDTLLEDVGAFGLANQVCMDYSSRNTVFRRVFCRSEGGHGRTQVTPNQINYYNNTINPSPPIWENVINVAAVPRAGTIFYVSDFTRDDGASPGSRMYGSIHYTQTTFDGASYIIHGSRASGIGPCTGWVMQDTLVHTGGNNYAPVSIPINGTSAGCSDGGNAHSGLPQTSIRTTTISPSTGLSSFGYATPVNLVEATTVGGTSFDYTGTNNTAKLCFRYVNGSYTSTPLWPWPMDDRIKAAITSNTLGAGALDAASPALAGTSGTGYAAATVTSEIVSLFGSIPMACNSSGTFTPSFPVASDFPAVAVIDDFNRANSGTLGANWTNRNISGTWSISSNQAVAPSFDRAYYSGSQITASHEVYATWTTILPCCGNSSMLSFAGTDLASNNSQYRVMIDRETGSNATMQVRKFDSVGTETIIIGPVDLGADVADNESFGVRVSGTTISMYWKYTDGIWYRTGEATDSSLPGGSTLYYGGIAGGTPSVVDNFGAGPTPSQPPISPPNLPSAGGGFGRFGTTFPGVR